MTTRRQLSPHEIDAAARACHEVNRAYCMTLGDYTHAAWDDAPEWQRATCRKGVHDVLTSEMTPEKSHEAWYSVKIAEGWAWGPVKDAEKKTHPCLVAYADLPEDQRYKDVLFTTVAKAMVDGFWRRPQ